MILDYRYPDDIEPSRVPELAEACHDVAVHVARWGNHAWADDLMSAARLLRLLANDTGGGVMAESSIGDFPLDGLDRMIDRATVAHDADPEGEDHDRSWCAACWAADHADEIAAMERATTDQEPA